MAAKQTPHRGFDLGKQLSIALAFVGAVLMLNHLAGQVREGSAPGGSLAIGAACFICGLLQTLLFLILIRLHRIEQRLLDRDRRDSEEATAD